MVFGAVNSQHDPQNVRQFDRIVINDQGDLALAHFADPVPGNVWIPDIATTVPQSGDPVTLYGWGPDGTVLRRAPSVIYDAFARENAAALRSNFPQFAADFPANVQPMVLLAEAGPGDSGAGVFTRFGVLAGVHWGDADYQHVNGSGNLYGDYYHAAYEQPLYPYRNWIRSVLGGERPPQPPPARDDADRRRLSDKATSGLPMTPPPPATTCDPGPQCPSSTPAWTRGILLGAGNYRGTALARCATAASNACAFNQVTYATGASARMPLGPSSAPTAMGTRQVMVWCKSTAPFPDATSPAQQVLRVSFTNADSSESPLGNGWWDVTAGQVGTGADQTLLDTSPLASC
jgi:hypothetical protein